MKVFILMEENSPELYIDCGAYYIIGVYDTWEKARAAADERVVVERNCGYLEVGEDDINDDKQIYYNIFYKDGDTEGILWSELRIESVIVQ